jgi:hypothetical protein
MSLKEKLSKEGKITISGVALMYIANVLRERQIAIFNSMAEAVEAGETEDVEFLGESAITNQIVGQKVLDAIETLLGKDIAEKFIDGKLEEEPLVMPTTSTLN